MKALRIFPSHEPHTSSSSVKLFSRLAEKSALHRSKSLPQPTILLSSSTLAIWTASLNSTMLLLMSSVLLRQYSSNNEKNSFRNIFFVYVRKIPLLLHMNPQSLSVSLSWLWILAPWCIRACQRHQWRTVCFSHQVSSPPPQRSRSWSLSSRN